MHQREPILIGDYLHQMGVIRNDHTIDHALLSTLFYYEDLRYDDLRYKNKRQKQKRRYENENINDNEDEHTSHTNSRILYR